MVSLCFVVGALLVVRRTRVQRTRSTKRTRRLGRRGEERAWRILQNAGYRIVERECVAEGVLAVDGVEVRYAVRADAIVARKGKMYVAEAKGGDVSAKISTRATRRQLMEYAWIFPVDGVLLVDSHNRRIHTIHFVRRARAN